MTNQANEQKLPRMVWFRSVRSGLPHYVNLHLQHHVDCLRHFFDVVIVEPDCDYREVCDRHEPDIALFETSVYSGPRRIRNVRGNDGVLKAGLYNSDGYCATRSTFVSDMAEWDVEAYFTIAVSLAEYFPGIAGKLFNWPNFVDETIYRDYGLYKSIPVLFTGSQATHYPWRSEVNRVVAQHYPTLAMPHFGWFNAGAAQRMLYGEKYARMINSAVVAPACGSIAKEVVRKHFEIPACGTILVTERTPALEAAGFIDMQNCVFAEPRDVVEKLDHVFGDAALGASISKAGAELVHSRHTSRSRDQIRQWYELKKSSPAGTRIVQQGPFGPLVAAPDPARPNGHVISGATDRPMLHAATRMLAGGDADSAAAEYRACLNYHMMPEPMLGLARCHLRRGETTQAEELLFKSVGISVERHLASEPDPIEWAYLLLTLLASGDSARLMQRAAEFPALRHPLLDRMRLLVHKLHPRTYPAPEFFPGEPRVSVHDPFGLDAVWLDDVVQSLRAAGRDEQAAQAQSWGLDGLNDVRPNDGNAAAGRVPVAPFAYAPLVAKRSLSARARIVHQQRVLPFAQRVLRKLGIRPRARSPFMDAMLRAWLVEDPASTLAVGARTDTALLEEAVRRSPTRKTLALARGFADAPTGRMDALMLFVAPDPVTAARLDFDSATLVALTGIHDSALQHIFSDLVASGRHELLYFDATTPGRAILRKTTKHAFASPDALQPT